MTGQTQKPKTDHPSQRAIDAALARLDVDEKDREKVRKALQS